MFTWVMSETHVLVSIIALTILTLAAMQALLISVQQVLLKRQPLEHYVFLRHLPPMETMRRWLFRVLWLGFGFLSCSLVSGFIFFPKILGHTHIVKIIWASFAWGLFATLLYGNYRYGWSTRTVVIRTLLGVGLLGIAYFGSIWIWKL